MREFSFQVSDFTKGITPSPIQTRNSDFMTDVYNAKVGRFGIESAPSISTLSDMPSIVWPLPQIVKTSTKNYVISSTTLYELETGTMRLIDLLTSLSGTRQWDVADFGLYQLWTNGTELIQCDENGAWTEYALPAGGYTPYTLCNYRGQLIFGGVGDSHKDWVVWSQIGAVRDLDDMLIPTVLGLSSGDMKNTAGCRKIPYAGQVRKVLPLDTGIVVYSEGGLCALVPVTKPAPTYGMKEFGDIRCSGAAGGNGERHLFTDEDGYLWTINKEFKLERLGYNQLFAGEDVVIGYEATTKDFYISTSSNTYILSSGLSRLDKVVTSIAKVEGSLIAPYTALANTYAMLVSDVYDLNTRGIKTITAIELATDSEDIYVAVDYRFRGSDAFRTSSYKQVYRNGIVFPIVSGDEFRIRVRGTDASDFNITHMVVRYKAADKRSVRGLYETASKRATKEEKAAAGAD